MQPPGKALEKNYILVPGHMTMMAAMPIYNKILKNLPVHNHLADRLETWYVAFREVTSLNFYINGAHE